MKRGYIILWRCIRDNHFWQDKPFDRCRAWIDLLMMANHTDGVIRSRGISIPVLRGQVGTSEMVMADKWGWSRGKVRRLLKELREKGQIVQQNNNVSSLITITNYDLYQFDSTADSTANGHQTVQQTDTKQYPKKELKNGKNKNTCAEFDEFWEACPSRAKRCGRPAAEKSWAKHVNGSARLAIESIKRHATCKDWMKDNGEYIPMATTWINNQRWTAEIECEDESWKII